MVRKAVATADFPTPKMIVICFIDKPLFLSTNFRNSSGSSLRRLPGPVLVLIGSFLPSVLYTLSQL